jgi:hypothetical protein
VLTSAGGDDLKPWHLKSSFATYDDKGKNPVQGSLEVFWAGPNKYKRIYTIAGFTQTEYGVTDGIYHSGSQGAPPYPSLSNSFILFPIRPKSTRSPSRSGNPHSEMSDCRCGLQTA